MTFLKTATLALAALLPLTGAVPTTRADDGWDAAEAKAVAALAKLSMEEKVKVVTGEGWLKGPCVGTTAEIPSIGYPQLCLQDGPLGIRNVQGVTAFPAGVQAASTWDRALIYARGNALGTESKAMGVHVQLGPVAGPLGKIPVGGRNWEGFSPDPYLTGIAMAETIKGMQDAGVQACAKHYIGNEQELNRMDMSSHIADRVNHELYLWPFADSVKANVASVMCSYNKLNGTYACENDAALNGILKGELDFRGYVVSDWGAQHTTKGSANGGMDMAMPGDNYIGTYYVWGKNLIDAVSNGEVEQARVDDMVKRILSSWYYLGQDAGYPKTKFNTWLGGGGGPDVQGDHKVVARDIARDGIVLLKNENNTLPLNKPASLAIIGSDAINNPFGPNACSDRGCNIGTLAMGWGSGSAQFPYLIAPLDAIQRQADVDGTTIVTSTTDIDWAGADAAKKADTAIVFINADSGEQYITVEGQAGDRANLDPWHNGNGLVEAVAKVNNNTIVVIHSVGPLILEKILALPNVVAVVWAGLPGQESGNGLTDILYGAKSPSGKLPYTIAKQATDYGTAPHADVDDYSEGLYIDYRHFDEAGIEPRYEFGFGLSYTTFKYSDLTATYTDKTEGSTTTAPGGAEGLYDVVATVTAKITNTGTVEGAEVAQLYIGLPSTAPSTPVRQLRGFSKINLAPGESGTVTFSVRRRDLSYWDTDAQKWVTPTGEFTVSVGASSRNLALKGTIPERPYLIPKLPTDSSKQDCSSPTTSPQTHPPMAHAEAPAMSSIRPTEAPPAPTAKPAISPGLRNRRQLGLFFGGAMFFGMASMITRRSLVRRYKSIVPSFYQPSNQAAPPLNLRVEAMDALTIATANVLSVAMMCTGGMLWAFDIASMDELRAKMRGRLGTERVAGGGNSKAEKELEEWLGGVLLTSKKDTKDTKDPKDEK
ncbi:hypothetical protein V494_05986 [Pseudogymnoascus sp. VKM F-4513 (FW-928)]|nr:hypothetical protein V494_05986 [Pseudogymnoascus sp. VKM F-4513 (FW-928)]